MARDLLAQADAELIRRRGLAEFIKRAWKQVDNAALIWNWHIDAMAELLTALSNDEIFKLLICIPPGLSKSLTFSVLFHAWEWTHTPESKFITTAYGADLALRDAKRSRLLINSRWYQERWGSGWDEKQARPIEGDGGVYVPIESTMGYYENPAGGYRYSTSVQAGSLGRHGHYLFGDDLVRPSEARGNVGALGRAIERANTFWFDDLETRGLEGAKRGLIMQRQHFNDPPARCIDEGYVTLMLPMEFEPKRKCFIECIGFEDPRTEPGQLIDEKRFSAETVASRKTNLGSISYEAQYQQNPAPPGGTIFKKSWFQYWGVPGSKYAALPQKSKIAYTQSWDLNFGERTVAGSYVVGQIWARVGADHLLIHQVRDRFDAVETISEILKLSKSYDARRKLIEKKAAGAPVARMLRDKVSGLVMVEPGSASKTERAIAVTPTLEAGNVFLPHPSIATFDVEELEKELLQFPLGAHDDQVDALTQYLQNSAQDSYALLDAAFGGIR